MSRPSKWGLVICRHVRPSPGTVPLCEAHKVRIVNIVSKIPAEIWVRELPPCADFDFVHSREPIEADYHVVYGIRDPIIVPNDWSRVVFVASEPPEIREYNLKALSRFGMVVGPLFPGVKDLPNYRALSAVAPWWVGVNSSTEDHYETHSGYPSLSREQLLSMPAPRHDALSVIVSRKTRTPLQEQRLRLVDYLVAKLPGVEVFGVGASPLADKASVLSRFRYHLAVENSVHPRYWTEKLADPVLLRNFVFYGGSPSYRDDLGAPGISLIDPFNPEACYRSVCEAMESDFHGKNSEGLTANRDCVLNEMSFHRQLSAILLKWEPRAARTARTVIPAQHPNPGWKRFTDPLYRGLSFRRN